MSVPPPIAALIAALVSTTALAGCGKRSTEPTPAPTPVTTSVPTVVPVTPPPEPSAGTVTLSGTVFEVSPDGTRRPLRARQVHIEVDVPSPTDPKRGGWTPVRADGTYSRSDILDKHFVKIDGVGIDGPSRYRQCAVNTVTNGDTRLDVELFLPGAALPSPILSGQIYTVSEGRRLPVAGVDIGFASRGFGPDVWALSDAEGGYDLCGIPPIPGKLLLWCVNEATAFSAPVHVTGDSVRDIDATAFRSCLWPPP